MDPGFMFGGGGGLFTIIFLVVVIGIVVSIIKGIAQWNRNNQQPVLSVEARLVGKRDEVRRHTHNNNGAMHSHSTTYYYITFEVESGDRMEFSVNGNEYGMLAEGDMGKLTFQGTRYLGFERRVY